MRVAVLGAGSIGLGTAALLGSRGHEVALVGRGLPPGPAVIAGAGEVAGSHAVTIATMQAALDTSEAAILTVPGNAHRAVLGTAAPHLRPGQPLIVSSHASLGGLWLARQAPGVPVIAWGTTIVTGRRTAPLAVNVTNIRARVDAAALPATWGAEALALCQSLFGDRFALRDDLVAITLSNLNPQNHLAMVLCNLTRIERAEDWGNYWGVTPAVGRMMEALDRERLAVATAYGVTVRTIFDHFRLSFAVDGTDIAGMCATIHARGNAPLGPKSLDSRYITEDVPFGLVATEALARAAHAPVPLHTGGIDLCSAALGRDFRAENDLLPELTIEGLTPAQLRKLVA